MVVFLLALLLITAVALSVVAAFAMPHLRAGSPVLTDRGERVAHRWRERLRPVTRWVMPVLRPVARWARTAARPLVRAVRPKVAPLTQAISRAVEEGTAPSTVIRRPAAGSAGAAEGAAGSAAREGSRGESGTDLFEVAPLARH